MWGNAAPLLQRPGKESRRAEKGWCVRRAEITLGCKSLPRPPSALALTGGTAAEGSGKRVHRSPRPVNSGHAGITGSGHRPTDNVTPHSRALASPRREVRQGTGSRSAALSAPLGLWFQATQATVNSSSPPAPGLSAHPDADSLKRPKATRPKLTSDVQVPFRERSAPANEKAGAQAPQPGGTRAVCMLMLRTGPCATGAPWPPSVRFSIHQPAPGLASFPQEPGAHGTPPSASPHLVSPALRPPGPGRHPLVTPPQPHRALLEKVPASRGLTPPRGHQAPKPAWGVPHLSSSATHLHAPAHTAVLLPEKTKTHL